MVEIPIEEFDEKFAIDFPTIEESPSQPILHSPISDLDKFATETCRDRCGLIVDTRERMVTPFIEAQVKDYPITTSQVTAGDYSIVFQGKIVAIIERKTLDDYAASIKDSRHENKEKMKAVRDQYGCQVYYIVEGPLKPPPSAKYGGKGSKGIPYYPNIDNSIFRLRTHHDIFVIRSEGLADTALQIDRLLIALTDKMMTKVITGGTITTTETASSISQTLSSQTRRTDDRVVIEMWKGISGVSESVANALLNLTSLADLLTGKTTRAILKEKLKTGNNRSVNDKTISNIAALTIRETVYDGAVLAKYATLNKVLGGIPGLTRATASKITGNIKSWELPTATPEQIGNISQSAKRKVGVAMGEKVLKYITYSKVTVDSTKNEVDI